MFLSLGSGFSGFQGALQGQEVSSFVAMHQHLLPSVAGFFGSISLTWPEHFLSDEKVLQGQEMIHSQWGIQASLPSSVLIFQGYGSSSDIARQCGKHAI